MRIWHEKLIPKLCRQHLLAVWREGLGCYKIITENKKGYRNHPATKEFEDVPLALYRRLEVIRAEMLNRGYYPKPLPDKHLCYQSRGGEMKPWQTLKQQVAILKAKKCDCKI